MKEKLEINLLDLPHDKYFVGLKKEFNHKFIKQFKEKYFPLMKNCKSVLGISDSSFCTFSKRRQYPLYLILRLSKILEIKHTEIHSNLVYLRTWGHSININPNFPIKLSKELARIIAHLFGDGVLCMDKRNLLRSAYYNQEKSLREEFKKDVSKIFRVKNFHESIHKTTDFVSIPTSVSWIIYQMVQDFNGKSCRIPNFIKRAPNEVKKSFIRAFFDDESHVYYKPPHRYIEIGLNNKLFLKDLKSLIEDLGINTTKIYHKTLRGFDFYYFYIRHFHNLLKYSKEINFLHSKKRNKLNFILSNPGRKHYSSGETEKRILNALNKGFNTINEISKEINRDPSTVWLILEKLRKNKIVKKHSFRNLKKGHIEYMWKI